MLEILAVDLEDLLVVAEDVRDFAHPFAMEGGHLLHPVTDDRLLDRGHFNLLIEKRNGHNQDTIKYITPQR